MKKATNLALYGSFLHYLIFSILVSTSYAQRKVIVKNVEKPINEVSFQEGLKEHDRIKKLPGQPRKVNFEQYGGYITVNQTAGRALFYYFVEADCPNKDSAPLLLWLNGGPGCSSLGYGAMQEIGPFRVKSDGKKLYQNIYAWNKVANVLFLESPVGVGFSYSNTSSDVGTNGDKRTAEDGYVFLLNWLERFPEYKNKDLYIAGESYAGHYIPQLADTIVQHNKLRIKNIINLKGISIGNPSLNDALDMAGMFENLWSHAFIPDNSMETFRKSCNFSDPNAHGDECTGIMVEALQIMEKINKYNIYAPICQSEGVTKKTNHDVSVMNVDPCSNNYVVHYMNQPKVQLALHANVTKLNHTWELCIDHSNWADAIDDHTPILKDLLTNGIRVLVYSGDLDSARPFTGTKEVIKRLNLKEKAPWTVWNVSGEVGGYGVEYNGGLTYTTVRGAGHMVPSDQPERALTMIKSFLKGQPLPKFVEKQQPNGDSPFQTQAQEDEK